MKPPKLKKLPESIKSESVKMEEGFDNRPTFEISEDMLSEVKEWKVGEKYMLMMEVEQTSARVKDYGNDKGKVCATFKITKIAECDMEEDESDEYAKGGTVSSEKAKEILKDGKIRNKKISEKQRKFFGAIAGGAKMNHGGYSALNGAPISKMSK